MDARGLLSSGERWTDLTARLMLPILAERAMSGETITYGEMDATLAQRYRRHSVHPAAYGRPAGKIGDVILKVSDELGAHIPPLNLILVNKATGLPGEGADYYLSQYVSGRRSRKVSRNDRDALAAAGVEKVKNYPSWERVLRHLGLAGIERAEPKDNKPIKRPPMPRGWGGEGEAHKSLKEWVAAHPKHFKAYGALGIGDTEAPLDSGDSLDVLFASDRTWLGVEVKATGCPEAEHWRGIFQCVKYRATLRAMRTISAEIPNVRVLLVVEEQPTARIEAAAKRLDVPWMDVSNLR